MGTPGAADQCEQRSDQPYSAGIDTREVVEQPPGYEAELYAVRNHASVMNHILEKFPLISSAPLLHGIATWTLTNSCVKRAESVRLPSPALGGAIPGGVSPRCHEGR